ncbi:unnamed protein product [Arctia plantaginis]|uniref:Uncharacterized protein n=1 Tax=Arctia plantaginis TaxID=874455 RepID=A0A8S1BFL6_ARCPL|nr:unnamed protein product [Arctia plantaginis]CAB3258695.1 unnamed protein product [Arctia plantaginis]
MFAKLLFLVVITTANAAAVPKDCECNSESDKLAVWSYLKDLSRQIDDASDKTAYSVLPAVLSPLVGCDCQEKIRSKRKIMPNVPDTKSKHLRHEKKYAGKKTIHYNDRHCPSHYVRVGYRCVKEELLD